MKTSIVVPVYGDFVRFLADCLDNLRKQDPYEIIVASNGRTDSVAGICEKFKVKLVTRDADAQPPLINFGFQHASGEYFLDMGVDDLLESDYLAIAEAVLDTKREFDMVIPQYRTIGDVEELWIAEGLVPSIVTHNTVYMGSLMRRSLWEKVGGFDENIPYHTLYDWEFWIRVYKSGAKAFMLDKPLYVYRVHEQNTNRAYASHGTEFMEYAKAKGTL